MAKVYDNATDLITFARLQAQNTTSGSSYLGSDGLLKFAAEDEPRIEYGSDGSLKGLLIEEQRTNLVTYSEDFTDASWSQASNTMTSVGTTSAPDGTSVTIYNFGDMALYGDFGTTSAITYTGSIWVKADKNATLGFRVASDSGGDTVDVSVTTEWQRFTHTQLAASSDPLRLLIDNRTSAGYFGSGNLQLAFYGAQLEEGTFATSYIPTSGSTVTRSPDIASIPVSAFGYNQDAGTVVVDFATLATFGSRDGNDGVFSLRDNSTDGDDLVQAFITPTDNLKAQVISGGSSLFSTIILANLPEQTQTKTAVGFVGGSYAASVDGGTAQSLSTSTTYPVTGEITELAIGEINNNGTKHLNGHIKSLSYFPRRLTDAQLQELTS